jgi:hypothetical protein
MKGYKCFYAKNLNHQSDCNVSNPRIFKDEVSDCISAVFLFKKLLKGTVALEFFAFLP